MQDGPNFWCLLRITELYTVLKVIYPKYSKHWFYKIIGYFFHFSSLYPAPYIELYLLAYLNFWYEIYSSFSTAQNGPVCPD